MLHSNGNQNNTRLLLYMVIMGWAVIFGLLRNVVFGKILGPESMGYYTIALTVGSYGAFLHLGLLNGLNRELPVLLGQNREPESLSLVGGVSLLLFLFQVLGLIILVVAIYLFSLNDVEYKYALYGGGLVGFSNTFGQLILLRLRANQFVIAFAIVQLLVSFGSMVIGLYLINILGYPGGFLAIIFTNVASYIICSKFVLRPANYIKLSIHSFKYLLKIGFPLMISGLLVNLVIGLDKLFLIKYVTPYDLGIYQIGLLPLTFGILLNSILGQYISPRLLFHFGRGDTLFSVFRKSIVVSVYVIIIMLLCYPIIPIISKTIMNTWLTDYVDSIPLIKITYLGSIFMSANLSGIAVNAANKQFVGTLQASVVVIIAFFLYKFLSIHSKPILWYAYANMFLQIILFISTLLVSLFVVKNNRISKYVISK